MGDISRHRLHPTPVRILVGQVKARVRGSGERRGLGLTTPSLRLPGRIRTQAGPVKAQALGSGERRGRALITRNPRLLGRTRTQAGPVKEQALGNGPQPGTGRMALGNMLPVIRTAMIILASTPTCIQVPSRPAKC